MRKKSYLKKGDEFAGKVLLEVARLYCEGGPDKSGLNLSDVAIELGKLYPGARFSSMHIRRLFDRAKDAEIVRFVYSPPRLEQLARDLKSRYPILQDVRVIHSIPDYPFQRRMWGKAAAEYFEENVTDGTTVALSGGYTMYNMIEALPARLRRIHIYPTAIIGRGPEIHHLDAQLLVTLLWHKSRRLEEEGSTGPDRQPPIAPTAHFVTVAPYKEGDSLKTIKATRAKLLAHPKVSKVYHGMETAQIVFTGLGAVKAEEQYKRHSKYTTLQLLSELRDRHGQPITEDWLHKRGMVGDIGYSYFGTADQPLFPNAEDDFFLTLGVEKLRMMASDPSKKIVVVGGTFKEKVLSATLKGDLCNVLITDEQTARKLLDPATPE